MEGCALAATGEGNTRCGHGNTSRVMIVQTVSSKRVSAKKKHT